MRELDDRAYLTPPDNEAIPVLKCFFCEENIYKDILKKSLENKDYEGMGTTIALVVIYSDTLHIAHVGDSRVYLISKNKIEQITTDHSEIVNKG